MLCCLSPELCNGDTDCPNNEACVNRKCVDPCEGWCLKDNTACYIINHKPACACVAHYRGDASIGCTKGREMLLV